MLSDVALSDRASDSKSHHRGGVGTNLHCGVIIIAKTWTTLDGTFSSILFVQSRGLVKMWLSCLTTCLFVVLIDCNALLAGPSLQKCKITQGVAEEADNPNCYLTERQLYNCSLNDLVWKKKKVGGYPLTQSKMQLGQKWFIVLAATTFGKNVQGKDKLAPCQSL